MSIKEMRNRASLSQSELASLTGLKMPTLQAYEQGRKNVNGAKLLTLCKLASALNCSISDIVTDEKLKQLLKEVKI